MPRSTNVRASSAQPCDFATAPRRHRQPVRAEHTTGDRHDIPRLRQKISLRKGLPPDLRIVECKDSTPITCLYELGNTRLDLCNFRCSRTRRDFLRNDCALGKTELLLRIKGRSWTDRWCREEYHGAVRQSRRLTIETSESRRGVRQISAGE
jgi:hypothetical protein